jgi:protocatechuate 3,4-dioxygenase alpha subunit
VSDLHPTPSQTVGPFFSIGLSDRRLDRIVPEGTEDAVRLEGRVLDGAGNPVADAMVEVWQADTAGEYGADFGWGRSGTDDDGRFEFLTVKPGSVAGQAPHLLVLVFARGLLKPVLTRMYFSDEEEANARDAVLATVPPAERATLVAAADEGGLRFDVRLQGDEQTAFFDL